MLTIHALHIPMIRLRLYQALPHRRGEGVDPRQEFRRQLRFAMRNPELVADLFLVHFNKDLAAAQRLRERRMRPAETRRPIPRFSDILRHEQSKKAAANNSAMASSA